MPIPISTTHSPLPQTMHYGACKAVLTSHNRLISRQMLTIGLKSSYYFSIHCYNEGIVSVKVEGGKYRAPLSLVTYFIKHPYTLDTTETFCGFSQVGR